MANQNVLEKGGGNHKADPVVPMLYGEGEDEEEEVSVAPYAHQVTLAVGAQASQILAWAH